MSDAHPQGGDLFDMAKDGTKVPQDAAKPNYIPSVASDAQKKMPGLGSESLNEPALGSSRVGETVSAAGGELPEDIGDKYSRAGGKERQGGHTPHGGRNQPSHG